MLQVSPIPAFLDNYIWCIENPDTQEAVVVDPGSAEPVEAYLKQKGLSLHAILVTHHHPDHVGGIKALTTTRNCPIIGATHARYSGITQAYADQEQFELFGTPFTVMNVPGHTLDHIAFFSPADTQRHALPWLFCGDTLFSGGCGRLFEGTPEQMWHSLQRLASLPDTTLVFCAHEYTLSNLKFARHTLPEDEAIRDYEQECLRIREAGDPTLPSNLAVEKRVNLFLRANELELATRLGINISKQEQPEVATFAALRGAKDRF